MDELRVGVGQAPSECGNIAPNVATAAALATEAAQAGANLLVLPELFLCGYDLEGIARDPEAYSVELNGPELARLGSACEAEGIAVVIGACLRTPAGLLNAVVVLSETGALVGSYAKTHLWEGERTIFLSGTELASFETHGMRLGLGICYEAGFPEIGRAYALAGANALLFSAAFAEGDERRRYEMYHPMRALENTVHVIVANASGPQGGAMFFGRSGIYDPRGNSVAVVESARGIAVATLRHADIDRAHESLPYLRDRRDPLPPIHELEQPR